MTSPFNDLSPEQLREMKDAVPADRLESFNAAVAASGLSIGPGPDLEAINLHHRHGVQHDPKVSDYRFRYRDTGSSKFIEEDAAARAWAAGARLPVDFAAGILDRLQETAGELAKLSPAEIEDRRLKAEAMLGAEHAQIVSKAKAVAGDLQCVKPGQIETDIWLARSLASFADQRTALDAALSKRGTK